MLAFKENNRKIKYVKYVSDLKFECMCVFQYVCQHCSLGSYVALITLYVCVYRSD